MAQDFKAYKIFIATPSGLEMERKLYRDVIAAYNESDANHRKVHFLPVGWEITLGGIGRPQALINEEIDKCDYFVLLLWDRWGSSPSAAGKGKFTSGTEEEHHVAWECYQDRTKPMRQIVAFFKAVEPRQLSDPGEQLKKVLDFRRSLERDKKIMFDTFDSPDAFEDKLRCYLAQWVRDHEAGKEKMTEASSENVKLPSQCVTPPNEIIVTADSPCVEKFISEAWEFADQGRITDAETKFAQAIVSGDPEALNNYGLFLDQVGRQQQAEYAFVRALELSAFANDEEEKSVAYENLGSLFQKKGDLKAAEQMHRKALEIQDRLGNPKGVAASYGNLGSVFQMLGDLFQAEQMHRKALDINTELGFQEGMAASYSNIGAVLSMQPSLQAEKHYRKALELYQKLNNQEGVANQFYNLGLLFQAQEKPEAAKDYCNRALLSYSEIGLQPMVEKVRDYLNLLG